VSIRLKAAGATDVGNIRDSNEDDLLIVEDALFVVADGMGGHVAGEVASREAVDAMREAYDSPGSTDDLRQAVRLANGAVWKRGSDDPSYRGMGTTVTAVAVVDGDKLAIANVGDSRTYLLRDDELIQLTEDHSFVQEAVRSGQLTRVQAESHPRRSQLTRALGVGDDVDVDVEVLEPLTGDRLLLCSDGLWDEVGDELIAMVLSGRREPEEAASELVRWAKDAGGRDNITVIVVDVVDGGEGGRALSASAALDRAGDETTAVSRSDTPTVALPPDQVPGHPEGRATPASRWSRTTPSPRSADGSLMQAGGAAPPVPPTKLLTWRVLVFVVVLLGVLGAAALVVARSDPAWSVALDGNSVVVKEGDEIRERTPLQVNQMPRDIQLELSRGERVEDRDAARAYIDGITRRALAEGTLLPAGAGVVVTTTAPDASVTTVGGVPPVSTPNGTPDTGAIPIGP
jgi:protein phosphatase